MGITSGDQTSDWNIDLLLSLSAINQVYVLIYDAMDINTNEFEIQLIIGLVHN